MSTSLAPPDDLRDLPAWIARQATRESDGRALLAALGDALNAAGVPVSRLSIGAPSISPVHRGITLA